MKNLLLLFTLTFLAIGVATAQENAPINEKTPPKKKVEISPEVAEESEEEVFVVVEEMPRFPGCEDISDKTKRKHCANRNMLEFIYGNLEYPAEARKNKVEGTVIVRYIIGKDGRIIEPKVLNDIGAGCGEEALRVVNLMNEMPEKWVPGKQRGKNVDVKFNLPFKFKLPKK